MTGHVELRHGRAAFDEGGSGPALLLIHGAEATRESFTALSAALMPRAYVVAYDQRGCGESAPGGEHHIPDLADDAAELMARLGHATFSVMGTSLGGRVAQSLAARHTSRLDRLILCNTWPLDRALTQLNPEGAARLRLLREGLPSTARELAEFFYTPEHVAEHPALARRFERVPATSARAMLALEVHAFEPSGLAIPTLCISGSQDRLVPAGVMSELASRLPRALFEVLAGVGHSAAVQAPERLADLIARFLTGSLDRSILTL